jgi:hypothetical protein
MREAQSGSKMDEWVSIVWVHTSALATLRCCCLVRAPSVSSWLIACRYRLALLPPRTSPAHGCIKVVHLECSSTAKQCTSETNSVTSNHTSRMTWPVLIASSPPKRGSSLVHRRRVLQVVAPLPYERLQTPRLRVQCTLGSWRQLPNTRALPWTCLRIQTVPCMWPGELAMSSRVKHRHRLRAFKTVRQPSIKR